MACLVCLGVSVSEGLALCRSTPSESPVCLVSDGTELRVTVAGSPDGHWPAQMAISVRIAAPVSVMLDQRSDSPSRRRAGSLQRRSGLPTA